MVVVGKDVPPLPTTSEYELNVDTDNLPPPYHSSGAASSSRVPPALPDFDAYQGLSRMQPPIAHCNNVAIRRAQGKVTGSYVIDPELQIPVEMLAPLADGEERKNFSIDVESSAVNVDVWVAPPTHPTLDSKLHRTTISIRGYSIMLRLHNSGDRPFGLSANTSHSSGNLTLEIPRSFRGPLTFKSSSGKITFSPALEPLVATFSDYDNLRKCFVGDFKALEFGQGAWEGSMIEVDGLYSKIHLRFADEPEPKTPTSANGWGWLFGAPAPAPTSPNSRT